MNINLTYRNDGFIDVELRSGGMIGADVSNLIDAIRRAGFKTNVERVDPNGVEFDGLTSKSEGA